MLPGIQLKIQENKSSMKAQIQLCSILDFCSGSKIFGVIPRAGGWGSAAEVAGLASTSNQTHQSKLAKQSDTVD